MKIAEKGWGKEIIFASEDEYCGKLLCFDETGSKSSMHYHISKKETWYCHRGIFVIRWINPINAEIQEEDFIPGMSWKNEPGHPHQLICLQAPGTIFEVSTKDELSDNYRVFPGDSQKT